MRHSAPLARPPRMLAPAPPRVRFGVALQLERLTGRGHVGLRLRAVDRHRHGAAVPLVGQHGRARSASIASPRRPAAARRPHPAGAIREGPGSQHRVVRRVGLFLHWRAGRSGRDDTRPGRSRIRLGCPRQALLAALAIHPVDEQALAEGGDRGRASAERSQRSASAMTLLIVVLRVPAPALQDRRLIVLGAVPSSATRWCWQGGRCGRAGRSTRPTPWHAGGVTAQVVGEPSRGSSDATSSGWASCPGGPAVCSGPAAPKSAPHPRHTGPARRGLLPRSAHRVEPSLSAFDLGVAG